MRLDELISLLDEWTGAGGGGGAGQVWCDNLPFKEGGKKRRIRSGDSSNRDRLGWDRLHLSTPSSS